MKSDNKKYINYIVSEILSDSFIVFIRGVQYVKFPFDNVPHRRSSLVAELNKNGNVQTKIDDVVTFYGNFMVYVRNNYGAPHHTFPETFSKMLITLPKHNLKVGEW